MSFPAPSSSSLVPEATPTDTNKDTGTKWMEDKDIQEFPTNAFGQIEFVNEDEGSLKPSK